MLLHKWRLNRIGNELVEKTITQQKAKLEAYNRLRGMGLPVPNELRQEVEAYQAEAPERRDNE